MLTQERKKKSGVAFTLTTTSFIKLLLLFSLRANTEPGENVHAHCGLHGLPNSSL